MGSTLSPLRRVDRAMGCLYGFISGGSLEQPVSSHVLPLPDRRLACSLVGRPDAGGKMMLQLSRMLLVDSGYCPDKARAAYSSVVNRECLGNNRNLLSDTSWIQFNKESLLVSGLLRSIPLGIWGAQRTMSHVITTAWQDAMLSHPHPIYADACAVLAISIACSVSHMGTIDELYDKILNCVADSDVDREILFCLEKAKNFEPDFYFDNWKNYIFSILQNAFWHLLHVGYPAFNDSLPYALMKTNMLFPFMNSKFSASCAICGAILGALHGARCMPSIWLESIDGYIPEWLEQSADTSSNCWPVDLRKLVCGLVGQNMVKK